MKSRAYFIESTAGKFYGPFYGRKTLLNFLKKNAFRRATRRDGPRGLQWIRKDYMGFGKITRLQSPTSIPRMKTR